METSAVSWSSWRHDRTHILAAALCILAAVPLLVTGDRWLSHIALSWKHPMALMVLTPGTWLGDWTVGSGFLLLMVGVGFPLRRSRLWTAGLWSLIALYLSGLFTMLLKHTLCRARPFLIEAGTFHPPLCLQHGMDSFPSGHATQAFAIAVILADEYPRLAPLFYGFAAIVAASRVVLGVHYPSDVLVGAAIGILWGTACRHLFHRFTLAWNTSLARAQRV